MKHILRTFFDIPCTLPAFAPGLIGCLFLSPLLLLSAAQDVFASLQSHLDLVAFTNEVPRIRRYLTERFAAPGGVLTEEAEDALARGAVSRERELVGSEVPVDGRWRFAFAGALLL